MSVAIQIKHPSGFKNPYSPMVKPKAMDIKATPLQLELASGCVRLSMLESGEVIVQVNC